MAGAEKKCFRVSVGWVLKTAKKKQINKHQTEAIRSEKVKSNKFFRLIRIDENPTATHSRTARFFGGFRVCSASCQLVERLCAASMPMDGRSVFSGSAQDRVSVRSQLND